MKSLVTGSVLSLPRVEGKTSGPSQSCFFMNSEELSIIQEIPKALKVLEQRPDASGHSWLRITFRKKC